MRHLSKQSINPMPSFFDRYINLVVEDDLLVALHNSLQSFQNLDFAHLQRIGDKVYQPEKWTVKQMFQHIIDNERIQSYRALRFARNDSTELAGFDEILFAQNADAKHRTLEQVTAEFITVRQSSIQLFESLTPQAFSRTGVCFNTEISVLALGFVLVGHQQHHFNVLKERYWHLG